MTLLRRTPLKRSPLRPKKPTSRKRRSLEEVKKDWNIVTAALLGPPKRRPMKKKPQGERSVLVGQVDVAYAKLRKAQAEMVCAYPDHITCFICGEPVPVEEAHLMHCEPRQSMGTRYDDINCQPGCGTCNGKPLGDRAEFRRMLDVAFGPGTAERNEIKSKAVERMGAEYLRHLLEKFRNELKQLK